MPVIETRRDTSKLSSQKLSREEEVASRFVFSNVQLLFYGVLFLRLESLLVADAEKPGPRRKKVEDYLYIAIVSFYSDYVMTVKSSKTPRNQTYEGWTALYKKVVNHYQFGACRL